jgi:PhzF family phenazine biosynthesis protein
MGQKITVVDAFTDTPFAGNPAAVCILEVERDDAWMAAVAREMNLSETAFLAKRDDGWSLRWLTPAVEVDLCGHATLASAHLMWEDGHAAPGEEVRFHTRSGILTGRRGERGISLDFPAVPAEPSPQPEGLSRALGAVARYVGRSRFDLLVELESEAAVRGLRPDFDRLGRLLDRGVIVTGRADDPAAGYDFVSRFFAPAVGVNEDPVTGSAHCTLGPHWSEALGKRELVGYQASPRGGTVRVAVEGGRAVLTGNAVTVWRGELVAG